MPRTRLMTCPACGTQLSWKDVELAAPFTCPACRRSLRVSALYSQTLMALSILVAGFLTYRIGLRGLVWMLSVLALSLALDVLFVLIGRSVLRPTLRLSDHQGLDLGGR
jgi:hypothetical protein